MVVVLLMATAVPGVTEPVAVTSEEGSVISI